MEPGAAAEAEAVPHSCQPTFVLKKWQAVAMWSWAISVDTCAICRNPLSEPSLEWQAGNETDQGLSAPGVHIHLVCAEVLMLGALQESRLLGEPAGMCFIWIAWGDGSRLGTFARSATKSGSTPRSNESEGMLDGGTREVRDGGRYDTGDKA
eukprot:TRINITY_DN8425_c0_g1_i12.p1 TRINITY_DN8425_c0_g1~~TRINITY_DN8425_c0_g1_i12.p1  ORF type:complete len:152 (+),score=10.91 TRINITY_DN8425_c0_g1_i12:184-639(+)